MDEPDAQERHALDDPEKNARVVRALLICAPFAFVGCYILAWLQGAETRHSVLIAAVAFAMCLAAAFVIRVMGSKSWIALVALKIVVVFFGRR